MIGPKPADSESQGPGFTSAIFSFNSSIHSEESPTNTATLIAMHLCPAAPTAAPTKPSMVLDLLASGIITMWFFAPAKA